jgi:hypothetical protein
LQAANDPKYVTCSLSRLYLSGMRYGEALRAYEGHKARSSQGGGGDSRPAAEEIRRCKVRETIDAVRFAAVDTLPPLVDDVKQLLAQLTCGPPAVAYMTGHSHDGPRSVPAFVCTQYASLKCSVSKCCNRLVPQEQRLPAGTWRAALLHCNRGLRR